MMNQNDGRYCRRSANKAINVRLAPNRRLKNAISSFNGAERLW
ncbi:MAG TPA: hypothetical protein VIW45_16565 [Vicinamibacterales bacterium]